MKAKHLLFYPMILLLAAQTARSQSGITDKINADPDRAQNVNTLESEAEKAVVEGDDYTALVFYRRALEYDSLRMPALEKYGDAAMRFSAYEQAEMAYGRIVNNKLTAVDKVQLVKLAQAKFHLGKYEEAEKLYRLFLYIDPPSVITEAVLKSAQTGLENCEWALSIDSTEAELNILREINSDYADFAPQPQNGGIYFSSARFEFENDKHYPARRLAKTLHATLQPGDTLKAELADFNEKDKHTTNVTFNEKGDVMYYTVCDFIDKTAKIRCDIYMRKMTGGAWGQPVKLPPHINHPDSTNTEPGIGRAPGDSTEILYFVSNRPGGKGKRDIWYSRISGDAFSQPVNLADINTKENEITPFYHNGSGTLYFSSDSLSIGGFDIFSVKGHDDVWDDPVHMGIPINSPANDAYFSVSKNGKTGYFASNRKGTNAFKAEDKGEIPGEQACCYDIFRTKLEKSEMMAVICNDLTGDTLSNTVMRLLEYSSKGEVLEELKVKAKYAYFNFPVQPRRSYKLIVSKDHFQTDTLDFQTPPSIWNDTLIHKLCLKKCEPTLVITVFDKETLQPLPGASVKFTTIGEALPGGGKSQKPLAETLDTKPDTHRFQYPIKFNSRYKAAASKPSYSIDSTGVFSTEGLTECDTIDKKLYLTKGVSLKAFTISCLTDSYDTLYGVTYRLFELEGGTHKEHFVTPQGTKFFETTLKYDSRYMLTASKHDFTSDTMVFNTKNIDRVGFQLISHKFQLCPLDINKYLPIKLYFDNDEPDSNTMKVTTKREYRPTYVDYYRRKPEFLEGYSKGLTGDERQAALDSIDVLFERDVRGGWERLFKFSEILYDMMERGDYIELTLSGFASPRAPSAYNMNLSRRRVSSVNNHFLLFDGGIYKKFVDNGQIRLKFVPNGKEKAPKDISGDLKDRRKSVYDPRASRERRLEIIGVAVRRGTNEPAEEMSPNILPVENKE